MAKKQTTWQELKARGGPYTAQEFLIVNDRPGMTKVGNGAWECDNCGRIMGYHNAVAHYRQQVAAGRIVEPVRPEPPEDVRALFDAWQHTEQVLQDVGKDLAAAQDDLAKTRRTVRHDSEQRSMGREVSPAEVSRHQAMVQMAEARVQQLRDAYEEAGRQRNEALQLYTTAYGAFRRRVREEEQAKRTPAPEPKPSALDRWLGGKKSA